MLNMPVGTQGAVLAVIFWKAALYSIQHCIDKWNRHYSRLWQVVKALLKLTCTAPRSLVALGPSQVHAVILDVSKCTINIGVDEYCHE